MFISASSFPQKFELLNNLILISNYYPNSLQYANLYKKKKKSWFKQDFPPWYLLILNLFKFDYAQLQSSSTVLAQEKEKPTKQKWRAHGSKGREPHPTSGANALRGHTASTQARQRATKTARASLSIPIQKQSVEGKKFQLRFISI